MNKGYSKTEKRRALQPLLNCLSDILLPMQDNGLVFAVSGGVDSLALMESYVRLPGALPENVCVATLNHGQRQESAREVNQVLSRAKLLGYQTFTEKYWRQGQANEADLRQWRYHMLHKCADEQNLGSIVTAHHANDDAEGFIMDALGWGGGQSGSAMKKRRKSSKHLLLRPFLSLSRSQLSLGLAAMGVRHLSLQDPSDEKDLNRRSLVRHEILPRLSMHKAKVADRLARKAQEQAEIKDFMDNALVNLIREHPHEGLWIYPNEVRSSFVLQRVCKIALKRVAPSQDLRSSGRTLSSLCDKAISKGLKCNAVYQFSGAVIEVERDRLWVRATR